MGGRIFGISGMAPDCLIVLIVGIVNIFKDDSEIKIPEHLVESQVINSDYKPCFPDVPTLSRKKMNDITFAKRPFVVSADHENEKLGAIPGDVVIDSIQDL